MLFPGSSGPVWTKGEGQTLLDRAFASNIRIARWWCALPWPHRTAVHVTTFPEIHAYGIETRSHMFRQILKRSTLSRVFKRVALHHKHITHEGFQGEGGRNHKSNYPQKLKVRSGPERQRPARPPMPETVQPHELSKRVFQVLAEIAKVELEFV